jgi:hypothetical protein
MPRYMLEGTCLRKKLRTIGWRFLKPRYTGTINSGRTSTSCANDPHHPSLKLKRIDEYWSARVGLHYRALARQRTAGLIWFWIGDDAEYERLLEN